MLARHDLYCPCPFHLVGQTASDPVMHKEMVVPFSAMTCMEGLRYFRPATAYRNGSGPQRSCGRCSYAPMETVNHRPSDEAG